ncbi:hypothetical protein [Sphingomonas sp.]|uniref:hypothetical protein n=1 Tax=Sphingomonas sp. TaxID=28214 RepID=UPI003AFF69A6
MLIEGTGFPLAAGCYLYLRSQSRGWPMTGDRLPDLMWSGIFAAGLLLSKVPNLWVLRQARNRNAAGVRLGTLLMTLIGLALAGCADSSSSTSMRRGGTTPMVR